MKALNLVAYNQFEFGDVPEPEIGAGDVLIAVKACGICGSDVHGMDGSSGRRQPPIIMGHEASGTIAKVGEKVTGWNVGDRVTFDSTVYCGECEFCKSGAINLCDHRTVLGVSCDDYRQHGAFAEYVKLPTHGLHRIPDAITFPQAAFTEPVSVALHAVKQARAAQGETAVVIGAGLIGLLVIQALKAAGCKTVIAVDLESSRLELARELGATHVLKSGEQNAVVEEVQSIVGERGADLAMEVVGISPTVGLAIACVRKGGRVGLVGNLAAKTDFPLQAVVTRQISLFGSCGCGQEYPNALQLIADGAIRVDPIMSKIVPLSEGGDWFEKLHSGASGLFKVILEP